MESAMWWQEKCVGLWVVMLVIAPLFAPANFGGRGLDLTFNISVWFLASLLVCLGAFKVVRNSKLKVPSQCYLYLFFPILISLQLIIRGSISYDHSILRLIFIIAGIVLFFIFFQFSRKEKIIFKMLMAVVVAGWAQSIIAIFQVYFPEAVSGFFLVVADRAALGVFQQRNVLAIFLAPG